MHTFTFTTAHTHTQNACFGKVLSLKSLKNYLLFFKHSKSLTTVSSPLSDYIWCKCEACVICSSSEQQPSRLSYGRKNPEMWWVPGQINPQPNMREKFKWGEGSHSSKRPAHLQTSERRGRVEEKYIHVNTFFIKTMRGYKSLQNNRFRSSLKLP